MTQKNIKLQQPRWLYADRTPVNDSTTALTEAYPNTPNTNSQIPNIELVFSVENQVWWRRDIGAPSGTMRDRQNQNQRPLIEEPFSTDSNSQGLIKDVGGSTTYEGNLVFSRIETVEDAGEDPVSYKVPRKTYVTGFAASGSADIAVGVTADEYQTAAVDSGNVTINQSLDPDQVWWGGSPDIEGTRLGYTLTHKDSEQVTLESYITEYRSRSRR